MRKAPLLLIITLVAAFAIPTAPVTRAQQDDNVSDSAPAAAEAPAQEPADNDAGDTGQAGTPTLRDDYEPRERISKDKAESFPPDI